MVKLIILCVLTLTLWIVLIFCFEPWLIHLFDFEVVHGISFWYWQMIPSYITYILYTKKVIKGNVMHILRISWCCLFSNFNNALQKCWAKQVKPTWDDDTQDDDKQTWVLRMIRETMTGRQTHVTMTGRQMGERMTSRQNKAEIANWRAGRTETRNSKQ